MFMLLSVVRNLCVKRVTNLPKCWKVAKTEIFTVTMRVRIWESVPHMILAGEKGEIFRYETDNKEHKALVALVKLITRKILENLW